jgi:ABC-type uncharacterized transport system YnjBCD ATPase subunit
MTPRKPAAKPQIGILFAQAWVGVSMLTFRELVVFLPNRLTGRVRMAFFSSKISRPFRKFITALNLWAHQLTPDETVTPSVRVVA